MEQSRNPMFDFKRSFPSIKGAKPLKNLEKVYIKHKNNYQGTCITFIIELFAHMDMREFYVLLFDHET